MAKEIINPSSERETAGEVIGQDEVALNALYEKIYNTHHFVKEFMWNDTSYGAAVGTCKDLAKALGLASPDDITDEHIAQLPAFIGFAMPGSGATRVEAVSNAYQAMIASEEHTERVAAGVEHAGSVYGTFTVGDAKVTAYLPDNEPNVWSITIERDGEQMIEETLQMWHEPIFGPDVEDVDNLNTFIEALIKKYELE